MDEGSILFAFTTKQGVGGSGGTARLGYLLVGRVKVVRGIIAPSRHHDAWISFIWEAARHHPTGRG